MLKQYKVDFTIDGNNLSDLVTKVELSNSISKPYTSGVLSLRIQTKELMNYNMLQRGNFINLKLYVCEPNETSDSGTITSQIYELRCMLVSNLITIDNPIKNQETDNMNLQYVECMIMFVDMSVYLRTIHKFSGSFFDISIKEIIENISGVLNIENIFIHEPFNTEKLEQLAIPNLTLTQTIEYLDKMYGIYDGIPVVNYVNSKQSGVVAEIFNLNKRMQEIVDFTLYSMTTLDDEYIQNINEKKIARPDHPIFYNIAPEIKPQSGYDAFRMINLVKKDYTYYPDDAPVKNTNVNVANEFIRNNAFMVKRSNDAFESIIEDKDLIDAHDMNFRYITSDQNMHSYINTKLSKSFYKLNKINMMIPNDTFNFSILPGHIVEWKINDPDMMSATGKYFIDNIIRIFTLDNNVPERTNMLTKFNMFRGNLIQ